MMRFLIVIALLFTSSISVAQTLNTRLSKKKVLIGEPITLTYSVRSTPKDAIQFGAKTGEIDVRTNNGGSLTENGVKIEIRDPFKDSITQQKGQQHWVGQYTVIVWDSGRFIIPGPTVQINDSNFQFQDIEIYCDYSKKKADVELYDIREEYAEIPPEESKFVVFIRNYWWLSLVLLGIVLIIWLVRRLSKEKAPVKIVKAMSLKERTLRAIDALENEKLWEKDRLKEHYIELSYILRSYLTVRYDISVLEKTSLETKKLLLLHGLNEDTVDIIGTILSQSDMVKFAKSKPELISILKISTLARQIVAETSPLEFDNYE